MQNKACLSIGTLFYIIRKLCKTGAPNQNRCMFDLISVCGVHRADVGGPRVFEPEDFNDELLQANLKRHVSQCKNGIIPPVNGNYIAFGNADCFSFFLARCKSEFPEILKQLDTFCDNYIGHLQSTATDSFLRALLYLCEDAEFQSTVKTDEALLPYTEGCFPTNTGNESTEESNKAGYSDPARLLLLILLYVAKYYIDSPSVKETIEAWETGDGFSDWLKLAQSSYQDVFANKYRALSEMKPYISEFTKIDGENREFKTGFSERRFLSYFSEFCAYSFCDGVHDFSADTLSAYFENIIESHSLPVYAADFVTDCVKSFHARYILNGKSEVLPLLKEEENTYSFFHHEIQEYFTAYYFILVLPESKGPALIRQLLAFDRTYAYMDDLFTFMYHISPENTKARVYLPVLRDIFEHSEKDNENYAYFLENYCTADLPVPNLNMRMSELVSEIYINNAFPDSAILRSIFRTETTESIHTSVSVKPVKEGSAGCATLRVDGENVHFENGFALTGVSPWESIPEDHPEFFFEDFIPRKVYLTLSDIFRSLHSSLSSDKDLHTFGLHGRF